MQLQRPPGSQTVLNDGTIVSDVGVFDVWVGCAVREDDATHPTIPSTNLGLRSRAVIPHGASPVAGHRFRKPCFW